MRYDQILSTPLARTSQEPPGMSRRTFIHATSAVVALGAIGSVLGESSASATAQSPGIGLAIPIPYGNDFFGDGRVFHVEAPPFPGFGEDPSTVFNFKGASAVGYISGTVLRRNRKTGEEVELPFVGSDMRFMQGQFEGRDRHLRNATFGFV